MLVALEHVRHGMAVWIRAADADHHHARLDRLDELLRARGAAAVMRRLQDDDRQQSSVGSSACSTSLPMSPVSSIDTWP